MTQEVELSTLDLRYESYRMRNRSAESRLLASIEERGIEEPLEGVDTKGVHILLNGFKRCRCARRLQMDAVPYVSLSDDEAMGIVGLLRISNDKALSIVEQCAEQIEPGPVRDPEVPFVIRPPKGDAYAHIEGPKGELGFYLVSDGGISPYRCKVRPPSLINLTLLREMLVGLKMGDLFVTFGTVDINMGEVDR